MEEYIYKIDYNPELNHIQLKGGFRNVHGVTSSIETSENKLRFRLNPDVIHTLIINKATLVVDILDSELKITIIIETTGGNDPTRMVDKRIDHVISEIKKQVK